MDPAAAREAYLATLPAAEALLVLQHAEKIGPYSSDPDWLVALESSKATSAIRSEVARVEKLVQRIEAAAAKVEAQPKTEPPTTWGRSSTPPARRGGTMGIFALALATYTLVVYGTVWIAPRHIPEIVLYGSACAGGIATSAVWQWMEPYIKWPEKRRR